MTTVRPPRESGITSILSNRNFLFLWLSQATSATAQNGIHFVQLVLIENLTRSTIQVGFMILAFTVPSVIMGAIAGVVVDRTSKKRLLVVANVGRLVLVFPYIVAAYFLSDWHLLVAIYAVTFVSSAVGQFYGPAEGAVIPHYVPERMLLAANSMFGLTFIGAQIAGLVLVAPVAVKLGGVEFGFGVFAAVYFVATVFSLLLPPDRPAPESVSATGSPWVSAWNEFWQGWNFVRKRRSVYFAMINRTMTETLTLVLVMLAPGLVARVLHMAADDAAYLLAPAGVGMFLGTSLVGRFGNRFHRESLMNTGLFTIGIALVALGLVEPISVSFSSILPNPVPVVMVITFVMGIAVACISVPAQTILQERSPLAMRGRVFGVQFTLVNLASIPVLLFVGALADVLGITRIVMIVAFLVLVLAGLSLRFGHELLGEGHAAPATVPPAPPTD